MPVRKKRSSIDHLTPMEKQVLSLIAENKTSKKIAEELFISHRTVQNHRYNIAQKLDLKGSNKLLEFALENKAQILGTTSGDSESKGHFFNFKKPLFLASLLIIVGIISIAVLYYQREISLKTGLESPNTEPKIAVMPLKNMGRDSIQNWLINGLTEELIIQVSRIPDVRVIATGSIMTYKGNEISTNQIVEELNVNTLLEGSIWKYDSTTIINLKLIDIRSGENIWADQYEFDLQNFVLTKNDIAQKVARALEIELYLESLSGSNDHSASNSAAEEDFLKGRYFVNLGTEDGFLKAKEYLRSAISKDPSFSRAWAGLANVYTWMSNYGLINRDSAFARAREAANTSLELNPNLGEAHRAKGAVALLYDWDFSIAEKQLKIALNLNPSDVNAHRLLTLLYLAKGKTKEALDHMKQALQLDPLTVFNNAIYGRTLYFADQYELAEDQLQQTLEMDPDFWLTHSYLGETYLEKGANKKAIMHLEKALALAPDNYTALSRLGYGYGRVGDEKKAREILTRLKQALKHGRSFSFQISLIYVTLNNPDSAIMYLKEAMDARHDYILDLKTDPKLDPLRSDVRFRDFLQTLNL